MIVDGFAFFNELDVLELRLHELDPVVDRFVLVEATRTHSNQPKPLYFQDNKDRFSQFLHKIVHIVVDTYPPYENAWTYEVYQRNCILQALQDCHKYDTILISDVDEIPRASVIQKLAGLREIVGLQQWLFCYHLNQFCYSNPYWIGTKVMPYGVFQKYTPSEIRVMKDTGIVSDGGWHFTYLGGVERVIYKLESYAHVEHNVAQNKDPVKVQAKISQGKGVFGINGRSGPVMLDAHFPVFLCAHQAQFSHLIIPEQGSPFPTLESRLMDYRRRELIRKLLGIPFFVGFWKAITLHHFSRRALLKRILPKFFHRFLDRVRLRKSLSPQIVKAPDSYSDL